MNGAHEQTPPKVVTWGTFDCLHAGHKEFLRRVSKLGKLYVIVIPSDIKFENCGEYPTKSEFDRRNDLIQFGKANGGLIEDVFIDCYSHGLKSLLLIRPDLFCLGYDQDPIWDQYLVEFARQQDIKITFIRIVSER